MKSYRFLNTWMAGIGALSILLGAFASQALAQEDEEIEEIIVEGSLRSLPTQDVGSVFGFDKNLLETPRSASTVSSEQIQRFGIADIDDFVALAPGTFTQSFFGTSGLDVRGTAGETYFRGVRRLDNPGNYPTPIGASDRVDIVRGPASPIYGPSKIGGYLNFVPKSARADSGQYLDVPEGSFDPTWSPDGKTIAFATHHPETNWDIWFVPLEGEEEPKPFLQTPFNEGYPMFSPYGRWLAYRSNESGDGPWNVYVRPFPGPGGKWQISTGTMPNCTI